MTNKVTIDDARIFAKLLPTNIAESNISGRCNKFSARLAPLDFFDKFLNFTLFEAIMPVSEPDEKPEKNNKSINTIINISEESINYESLLRIVIVRKYEIIISKNVRSKNLKAFLEDINDDFTARNVPM